jgi:hypothetical protein
MPSTIENITTPIEPTITDHELMGASGIRIYTQAAYVADPTSLVTWTPLKYLTQVDIGAQRNVSLIGELGSRELYTLVDEGQHQITIQRLCANTTVLSALYGHINDVYPDIMPIDDVFDDYMIDVDEDIFDIPIHLLIEWYDSKGELKAHMILKNLKLQGNNLAVSQGGRYAIEGISGVWEETINLGTGDTKTLASAVV